MNVLEAYEAEERRMREMDTWAKTIGYMAEAQASLSMHYGHPPDGHFEVIASYDGPAKSYRGNEPTEYRLTDEGSVEITLNGMRQTLRSPAHVRDDSLPHGIHKDPNLPTFR